jgi:hypothetical protein
VVEFRLLIELARLDGMSRRRMGVFARDLAVSASETPTTTSLYDNTRIVKFSLIGCEFVFVHVYLDSL